MAGNNNIVLSVRNLTKTYRTAGEQVNVLRGVNLDVAAGERVALSGESGSGKSTLLHLIAGLDAAANGSGAPQGPRACASCDEPRVQRDLPIQRGGKPRAVGDHQKTAAAARHQIARQREHVIGGRLVEVAGRLIGEQQ